MKKKIFVTVENFGALTRIGPNEEPYSAIQVRTPIEARDIQLESGTAYIVEPESEMNNSSARDFGNLLYRICESEEKCVGVVRPKFLDELDKNRYDGLDKLRDFVYED